MNTRPPAECPAWQRLASHAESWRDARLTDLFASDPARAARFGASSPGLHLDYSRQRVGALTLQLLVQLAHERGLPAWRDALFAGVPVNCTEQRAARHTALRAGAAAPDEVRETLARMRALSAQLRGGELRGATSKPLTRLVNLGIGGSDLGPRLAVDALRQSGDARLEVEFAANADPLELGRVLERADAAATLFVIVSKTFTTQETLANARAAKQWLAEQLPEGSHPAHHFIAVTANTAAAHGFGVRDVLPMWDWVGGRFSVWSAVGFSLMAAIGPDAFDEFLAGACDTDRHFVSAPLEANLPALMGMLGIWNVNFLGAGTHAVLAYSHALRLLPAYLQQVEMESNGKRVDREGRAIGYATAPVLWGGEGTVSQHSFHQLLHQGTQVVPADFVVAGVSPELDANAEAQAAALAFGTADPVLPPHRRYPGNRPSSTLRLERVDARNLGRLLAAYEHKVFTQGVIWNVNSFDQWGVELGKTLADEILRRRT
jgi:glucose-6-phosphate isomerase